MPKLSDPVRVVDFDLDPNQILMPGKTLPVSEVWRVDTIRDDAVGASKVFTVPAGEEWQILWLWVGFITTSDVGLRQLDIHMSDGVHTLGEWQAGVTQGLGVTKYYLIAPAMPDLTAWRDTDFLITPLPPTLFLKEGQSIQVWDNNMVEPDDQIVLEMQFARRLV
jgi:hypothetical protein